MTDHDLEQRLRTVYREVVEPASPVLRASVAAIPDAVPDERKARMMNRFLPLGLAAAAVAVVLVVGMALVVRPSPDIGTPDGTTPPETSTALPTASEAAFEGPVHPWPGTRARPAGRYFWDMGSARWMHHGPVSLRIGWFAEGPTGDESAVTVAGFPAIYEEDRSSLRGVLARRWFVDIEGRRLVIRVEHGLIDPDGQAMTPAQVAEIDAIVESIRYGPNPNGIGFRLTFTLPDGWDSG